MKLSIIVPIYNVAPYLRKCVDSLLAQDISDYEIILVDDGSTDDSGAIADEIANQPTPNPFLKEGEYTSFAKTWGAHTADSTQYGLLKENAKANRKNPTEAESVMWDMLKGNNLGYHFRRQHIILDYIVDFICLEKGLVIELDGGYHNDPQQKAYDGYRTAHLQRLGYTELRFKNEELLCNPDSVIRKITETLEQLPSLLGKGEDRLTPLPFREELEVGCQIKVIHQANAGLSAARNTGVAAAQGDYIMFVDSDDYLQPNVLGALVEQVERDNLDVLRFNYQNVNERYEVFLPFKDAKRDVDYSEDIVDGETFLNKRLGPACYAVMFVVRREIVLQEQFTPNIYFEDTDWTPRMLINAQRVASTPMVVYNYLWRQGSITLPTDPKKREKVLRDKISLLYGFKEQMQLVQDPIWFVWMTSFNTMTILNMLATISISKRKPYLQELKSLGVFPLYTQKEKGLKRLKIQIANLSPALYCALMNLRNK